MVVKGIIRGQVSREKHTLNHIWSMCFQIYKSRDRKVLFTCQSVGPLLHASQACRNGKLCPSV